MNRWLRVAGIIILVLVVGVVAVVSFAMAQGPTPEPNGRPFRGHGFGMWGAGGWSVFDAAAEALGLTPEQLFTELHSGKTLEQVAQEMGVDLQAVRDAMRASRQEAVRQAIEQAVQDGRLSREQADWMLQGLENGWLGGRGFRGHGFGPGGLKPDAQGEPQGSRFRGHLFTPGRSL